MKKSLALLSLLASYETLFGSHNFYAGVSLKVNYLSGNRNDFAHAPRPLPATMSKDKNVSINKMYGGIFLGYLFRIHNFGFGPEFFYNYGTIENNVSDTLIEPVTPIHTSFDVKHRITANKGFNLRIGYFVGSYFLNTLFGVSWQTINYQVTARKSDLGAATYNEYSYRTPHKTRPGFSFGLGVQKQITESYDIGLEYKQTIYPRTKYEFNLDDPDLTKLTSDIKYKIHSIGLRFIYKF